MTSDELYFLFRYLDVGESINALEYLFVCRVLVIRSNCLLISFQLLQICIHDQAT